jgi:hypothetical protein
VTYARAALENKGTPVPGRMAQPEATANCLLVALKRKEVTYLNSYVLTYKCLSSKDKEMLKVSI